MDEYKPITGELRAKLAEYKPTEGKCNLITRAVGSTGYARLIELCDTIDAIHARLEAAYDRLRAERDSMAAALDAAQGEHAYAPESHYMMLPKDADGVPIHIGDVMEWCNGSFTVHELKLTEDGWQTWDSEHGYTVHADECIRHHTPDTWERIIEDAIRGDGGSYGCLEERFNATVPALVARCKALAGDAS